MTLQDYVSALRTHWIVIVLLTIIGGGAAYGYSHYVVPQYRSQVEVLVIPTRGEDTSDLVQGSNYVQNIVQTYTLLVTSPTVLQPVIDDLGIDETPNRLARRMDVDVPLNTVVIRIGVTDSDAALAQQTANAIADQLAIAVEEVSPVGVDEKPAVRVDTISAARESSVPISPDTRMNTLMGLGAGLVLGVLLALVRRRFMTRLTNGQAVSSVTDLAILGEIPQTSDGKTVARSVLRSPHGRVSESIRQIAANLKFVDIEKNCHVIMVTSGQAAEGKSSVSLGLALTMAESGKSVLYIEADLRRPSAARFTKLEGGVGLTTVLVDEVTLPEAVQRWGHDNLAVLTSGPTPPNPGHLLSSGRLECVIKQGRLAYDYLIVDTAPVLMVSDALWLSTLVDGTLLVVRANRTKYDDLRKSLTALENTPAPVLGVVVDAVKGSDESPYYTDTPARARDRAVGVARRVTRRSD